MYTFEQFQLDSLRAWFKKPQSKRDEIVRHSLVCEITPYYPFADIVQNPFFFAFSYNELFPTFEDGAKHGLMEVAKDLYEVVQHRTTLKPYSKRLHLAIVAENKLAVFAVCAREYFVNLPKFQDICAECESFDEISDYMRAMLHNTCTPAQGFHSMQFMALPAESGLHKRKRLLPEPLVVQRKKKASNGTEYEYDQYMNSVLKITLGHIEKIPKQETDTLKRVKFGKDTFQTYEEYFNTLRETTEETGANPDKACEETDNDDDLGIDFDGLIAEFASDGCAPSALDDTACPDFDSFTLDFSVDVTSANLC